MFETTVWNVRFLELAKHVAQWSKDPSTKCGAVITDNKRIISLGFNGLPQGVKDNATRLLNRELKLACILHAEENALAFARRQAIEGCTIYTWPMPPCAHCASAIIQSGIHKVVAPYPDAKRAERWGQSLKNAMAMYIEAGVVLKMVPNKILKTDIKF